MFEGARFEPVLDVDALTRNALELFHETPVEVLVLAVDVSPPLLAAISQASSADVFPFLTIGEFLAAGENAIATLVRATPGFEGRTAAELYRVVRRSLRKVVTSEELRRERLTACLCETPIESLFACEPLPVRVARALGLQEFGSIPFRSFVRDRVAVERSMEERGNCGQRSLKLLAAVAASLAKGQLVAAGLAEAQSQAALAALFPEVAMSGPVRSPDGPPRDCDLAGYVGWLLDTLPARAASILSRRFGIGAPAAETLADIGDDLGITRERVRQIEKRSLDSIRKLATKHSPSQLLRDAEEDGWRALAGERVYLLDAEAQARMEAQESCLQLLLEVARISHDQWIARVGVRIGHGWADPSLDPALVHAAAAALEPRISSEVLPRPLHGYDGPPDAGGTEIAAVLLLGLHVEAGYVFAERPSIRSRRAVGLHSLLAGRGRPAELVELHGAYRDVAPNDPCSYRDALIVMEAAPHLFVEIREGAWSALGPGGSMPTSFRTTEERAPEPQDEVTVIAALSRELERIGPTRLGVILERSAEVLPPGRSAHSIGPTLLMNRDRFIRPLPGVYALPRHLLNDDAVMRADHIDYLLEPYQARLYALGRRAGEPWGAFPLWTPASEYRLCRWARGNARPELFRSLLAIASPEDWPVDPAERSAWRELAARHGRFELAYLTRCAEPTLRPLDRVLAACLRLAEARSVNWMACNRILGLRIDSHAGTSLLALLVAARIAVAPTGEFGWQLPHERGPGLEGWTERLTRELGATGVLDWNGAAGTDLAAEVGLMSDERSEVAASGDPSGDEPDDLDEFEQLLVAHRRTMRAKQREGTLEWLGGE